MAYHFHPIMTCRFPFHPSFTAALIFATADLIVVPAAALADAGSEFFESKVRPVLFEHCYECHSGEKTKGGLALDTKQGWEKGGDTGPTIVPGNPDESLLIKAVRYHDEDLAMPPKKKGGKLPEAIIADLVEWVKMGAPDPRAVAKKTGADLEEGRKHWAFQPVTNPSVPPLAADIRNPIDAFIRAKLSENKLAPAPLADRATLLRRATYDLTGLPPTAGAIAAFVNDPRSDDAAFAQVIETLLASPAYGEKWGRFWLDLAHYADTTGCSSDWPIDDLWRYRDWVIAAFNEDKPFDRFLTEQLAGDLLAADMLKQPGKLDEKVYRERIVATGFLATAKRFGSNPGGYDHLTIGDSLDATWKALQGLTIGCARCHDHKFDPVMSSDYYALYGIFASSLYPYSGAEKNKEASLLVPLARPGKIENVIDAWNRELSTSGDNKTPRSVLASFSERWSFEDNETSEAVSDRAPMSPWVSKGGIAVRGGNSPFVHLLPKGSKLVDFQATERQGEMLRRVRWENESAAERAIAIDFQCSELKKSVPYRLKLAWRPQGNPAREVVLASLDGQSLSVAAGEAPAKLEKKAWHHLSLRYSVSAETVAWRLWNQAAQLLVDAPAASAPVSSLREPGDLVVRFEAEATNNLRQPVVRVDNIVAESNPLPTPDAMPAGPPVQVAADTNATKPETLDLKKAAEAERAATYKAVLPQKPETAFAMWEGTPHDVALQKRGEPASPGAVVPRRNLLMLGGQPVAQPHSESGRRDLARWLLDDANPLTLRVFVNRLWQWHFGRGIVASPNDFGHKGEPPTQPELLDYLVQRFRADGLSIKAMHREIMRSHAYRQSSTPIGDSQQRDPDNRWLSHFSPRRLTAEEVRDSVLYVAGRLDMAGAGHRQPFPPLNERAWSQHRPFSLTYEAKYAAYDHRKRSIYLPVVRLVADPFLSTFDGADSNQSVAVRGETAVPLQALALLNAPFVVEAANKLAALAVPHSKDTEAVSFLYRQVFGTEAGEAMKKKLGTHLAHMTGEQAIPRQEALAVIAQSLIGGNAFLYVF